MSEDKTIKLDIGAAMKMLTDSPELCNTMNELVGGPALVQALDDIEALNAEITRLRALTEWIPIETAPKDGSWFSVTSTWNEYARACFQWNEGWGDFITDTESIMPKDMYSHWMPLPTPPEGDT